MIETPRLKLFPCDDTLFAAMKMGDNVLGQALGANVPVSYTHLDVYKRQVTVLPNTWYCNTDLTVAAGRAVTAAASAKPDA